MTHFKNISDNIYGALWEKASQNVDKEIVIGQDLIQAAAPILSPDDLLSGVDALLNGWLTDGKYCKEFELGLAKYIGCRYVSLVNSGSSANLIAFASLTSPKLRERAIKPGDEVITVAAGFPTTVNPIVQYGCIPVFIDVDINTCNISTKNIEAAITDKTKAIVLAHSLGNPFNIDEIKKLTDKYNLWLIEDNCDALGATYGGQKTGSFGDLATLSFFPAHQITAGEGGAVLINNPRLKKIIDSMRNWGKDCWCIPGDDNTCGTRFTQKHHQLPEGYDHKYVFSHVGYNLKMTEMQAAVGLNQLSKINDFVEKRRKNHSKLETLFSEFKDFFILPSITDNTSPSWFGFLLICKDDRINRNDITNFLNSKQIGTRLFFAGNLTKQPAYAEVNYKVAGNLENTDKLMNDAFWLGVWPGLNDTHLEYMYSSTKNYLKEKGLI